MPETTVAPASAELAELAATKVEPDVVEETSAYEVMLIQTVQY